MHFSKEAWNNLKDNNLGLLMVRSQAQATKSGGWTYTDHELLVQALSELERLREAVNRYSVKLEGYHDKLDTCKCIVEEMFISLQKQKEEKGVIQNDI